MKQCFYEIDIVLIIIIKIHSFFKILFYFYNLINPILWFYYLCSVTKTPRTYDSTKENCITIINWFTI